MQAAEATLEAELAAIGTRLAELAAQGGAPETVGPELGRIRAHLRRLAEQNAEVGRRLSVSLGLELPPR